MSNGTRAPVARLALASFTNPADLEKAGGNGYVDPANSGNAVIGAAGSAGMGSLSAGGQEFPTKTRPEVHRLAAAKTNELV